MLPRRAAQVVLRRGGLALRDLAADERPALADFPGPRPEQTPAGGREGAVGPVAQLLGDLRQRQLAVGDPGQDDAVPGDTPCIYMRSTHAECYPLVYAPPMLARLLVTLAALAALASCTSDPSGPVLGSSGSTSTDSSSGGATEGSEGSESSGESSTGPAPQPAEGLWAECLDMHSQPFGCWSGVCITDTHDAYCAQECAGTGECLPGPDGRPAVCAGTVESGPVSWTGSMLFCMLPCDDAPCPLGMECKPMTVDEWEVSDPGAAAFCM